MVSAKTRKFAKRKQSKPIKTPPPLPYPPVHFTREEIRAAMVKAKEAA